MKKFVLTALLLAQAGFPDRLMAGDIEAGEKTFNGRACQGCHGAGGQSQIDIYPILAGKSFELISGELKKFRSGERSSPTMNTVAGSLSDIAIANIAAYLSSK